MVSANDAITALKVKLEGSYKGHPKWIDRRSSAYLVLNARRDQESAGTRASGGGCDKIFREQVSSVAERQQLEAALDYVREGEPSQ